MPDSILVANGASASPKAKAVAGPAAPSAKIHGQCHACVYVHAYYACRAILAAAAIRRP